MSEAGARIRAVLHIVSGSENGVQVVSVGGGDDDGTNADRTTIRVPKLVDAVQIVGDSAARWVWSDTAAWYPQLLEAGIRVERCVDLRLAHAILKRSALTADSELARATPDRWDSTAEFPAAEPAAFPDAPALFEIESSETDEDATGEPSGSEMAGADPGVELERQEAAIRSSREPGRLRLLIAAESAGALIAAEMRHAGLPWRKDVHEGVLEELLGPRPERGERPAALESLAGRVRSELGDSRLNPDSPAEVLRALHRAGLSVATTRSWELKKVDHPAIPPLLEYKKLSRLLSANGWFWIDAWVHDGRFHPDYVPGGVVSGRWATRGGGALQLPKQLRRAVVADDGWKLVVADAAQLEPRILAGLSADEAMATAGRGTDLYQGIVDSGAVETRAQAKVAMLGAMYGSTTGESALLMPRLARAYPRAIRFVENAARTGERGDIVTSRLGRSSPRPGETWSEVQGLASSPDATSADERRARSQAREWGRFTRNFVVQASAAEWALCWMAELRRRLADLAEQRGYRRLQAAPHLVYFLHDEIIVHSPARDAEAVREHVVDSAHAAGRLLFGAFPVEFPVIAAVVDDYGQAKG